MTTEKLARNVSVLTPEEIIRCPKDKKRPEGICWAELPEEKRKAIPVLQKLFSKLYK